LWDDIRECKRLENSFNETLTLGNAGISNSAQPLSSVGFVILAWVGQYETASFLSYTYDTNKL